MNKILYCGGKYYAIYMPTHPRALKDGYVYEHILVAESKLNRNLTKQEVVHHQDFNGLNNDPSNLIVLPSNSEHIKLHNCIRDNIPYTLSVIDGVSYVLYEKRVSYCLDCGVPLPRLSQKRCWTCAKLHDRRVQRPTREVLKREIRENSFLKLSRKYGVSDKAISKWCLQYGLPHKKLEINKIPDNQWNSL